MARELCGETRTYVGEAEIGVVASEIKNWIEVAAQWAILSLFWGVILYLALQAVQ